MKEEEIIKLWEAGIHKNVIAKMYRTRYNNWVKLVRLDVRHRKAPKFITSYQALNDVEKIIYSHIRN